MVSGEPTALRQKDLLGGHHITKSIKHFEYLSPKFYNAIERTVREQPTKVFLAIVKNFLINNHYIITMNFLALVNI
jgi:hypothetical protein